MKPYTGNSQRFLLPTVETACEQFTFAFAEADAGNVDTLISQKLSTIKNYDKNLAGLIQEVGGLIDARFVGVPSYFNDFDLALYRLRPGADYSLGALAAHKVFEVTADIRNLPLPVLSLAARGLTSDYLSGKKIEHGIVHAVRDYFPRVIEQRCGKPFVEKIQEQNSMIYELGAYTTSLAMIREIDITNN